MKSLLYLAATAGPAAAAADSGFDIALACAGGAVISAGFKYREAETAEKKGNIAVADAVLAAVCGMAVGWFGHPIGVGAIEKLSGVAVSESLAALVLSLLGIKIVEVLMTTDIGRFMPGKGKKDA